MLDDLSAITAEVIGASVDPETPLMSAGLDSLAAIELKNAVTAKFGVVLPATVAFDYPTLSALAAMVAKNLRPATGGATSGFFFLAAITLDT